MPLIDFIVFFRFVKFTKQMKILNQIQNSWIHFATVVSYPLLVLILLCGNPTPYPSGNYCKKGFIPNGLSEKIELTNYIF